MAKDMYKKNSEEQDDYFSNDDLFNITSWGADPSVRELIDLIKDGDIEKPKLQRNFVWNKKTASRFVESLLLGLPVPSIFLAMRTDEKRLIVDGFQRISTLYAYIKTGIWEEDNSVFKLVNSDIINERWRGKSYNELDDTDKRRLRNSTLHAIIFEQKHPADDSGLFQVFERINTGGNPLNNQEIRNCIYQGKFNDLLIELNESEMWKKVRGKEKNYPRMTDIELILRFFTLNNPEIYHQTNGSISLKKEMNTCMMSNKNISDEQLSEFKSSFLNMIELVQSAFGSFAFLNLQNNLSKLIKRLNPTVYDSIAVASFIALSRGYVNNGENLEGRRLALLQDPSYRESITQGTMQKANIHNRIKLALQYLYQMDL